jgi:hypothetical protein
MKKTGSVLLGFVLFYFTLRIINDVLEMGERLEKIHPWASIGFYLVLLLAMIWGISIPIRWMLKAPVKDFGALFEDEALHEKDLDEIHRTLMKNQEVEWPVGSTEISTKRRHVTDLLEEREKDVDDMIVQTGVLTFLTTAISPNGFIDILAVIYYNFRMIGSMVDRFGVRPSLLNILRILRNVFLTAFVVNQLEELEINEYVEEMVESFGDVATGKLLSKTLDSLIQGVLAGFVTLKIGYAAKAVLINPDQTKRYGFRKSIRKAARKSLVWEVLPKSAASVPKGFGRMIMLMTGKMKKTQPDMG